MGGSTPISRGYVYKGFGNWKVLPVIDASAKERKRQKALISVNNSVLPVRQFVVVFSKGKGGRPSLGPLSSTPSR